MYLVGMVGALWYDLPALAGHEVEELVDEDGGGEGKVKFVAAFLT